MPHRACPFCSRRFKAAHASSIYCSLKCCLAAKQLARKTSTCPQCGASFWPHDNRTVYCSRACYDAAHDRKVALATQRLFEPEVCACRWERIESPWHCACDRWKPAAMPLCEHCTASNGVAA